MYSKKFVMGFGLLLAGCLAPSHMSGGTVLKPLPVPDPSNYIDTGLQNAVAKINYRDALLGYQKYLTDYVRQFELLYNIAPITMIKVKSECAVTNVATTIPIKKAPIIHPEFSDSEINDILFKYISELRQSIEKHNATVLDNQRLIKQLCG